MMTNRVFAKCLLPRYLGLESLSHVLEVVSNKDTGEADLLTIDKQPRELPLSDDTELAVYFDWSQVVYFEDAALLHLVLAQQSMLKRRVSITHFAERQSGRRRTRDEGFKCNTPVLRQLGATGYFKCWLSPAFGASSEEAYRLSGVNPLAQLPPLTDQNDILPITSCQSEHALSAGSPEDATLRRYEEDAAICSFTQQNAIEMRQRRLIADGEFGQLIIRQCRKNTIEHAKPFTGALSMVRVVRRCDLERDWVVRFDDVQKHLPGPLTRLLLRVPKDCPVLDMTVVDNGCGIPASIGETWTKHILDRTEPWQRVERIADSTWPQDAKLIEFV